MAEKTARGEKVYTIPLRKDFIRSRRMGRANTTVNSLKRYLLKHTRAREVKISQQLNDSIWAGGAKKPPHRLKVKVKLEGETARALLPEEIFIEKKEDRGRISSVADRLKGKPKEEGKAEKKVEKPQKAAEEEKKEEKPKVEATEAKEKKEPPKETKEPRKEKPAKAEKRPERNKSKGLLKRLKPEKKEVKEESAKEKKR